MSVEILPDPQRLILARGAIPNLPCAGDIATGIDGNRNPWVIGASSHESENGFAEPLVFAGIHRIDDVVIRSVRVSAGGP